MRSDTETRFIRLSPMTQFVGLTGSALLVGWTIVASAILLMQGLGAGDLKEQALREQAIYEGRLNTLASERDARAQEAALAQERFAVALAEVSAMQSRLLASEERKRELEIGLDVVQATLRDAMNARDEAEARAEDLVARLAETEAAHVEVTQLAELEGTLDIVTETLGTLAAERDMMAGYATEAELRLEEMAMNDRLEEERNARIFQQIEDAVTNSLNPLDEMFSSVGLPTDSIIDQLRRTYTGQGGPLTPIRFTTSGNGEIDATTARAGEVLTMLDELTLYRIAAEKLPFGFPVRGSVRSTSGFGPRWGRMHEGHDWAGPKGTPIHATADGVVVFAGRQSGYGNLIKIRHEFGFETRYAHLSRIRVEVGQRVSRDERIGDMGNTGRSTGTHLHYEVLVGGKPVNPMKYIKAARDVF
ncbi:peptidoglycan DD-metalloendopeptidase family protein [Alphaproteobacteria bacterium GH1-50]|uniref:Peptidoglycan DD-metalloendopeptidase family protein n=2 Tax=Kangsaoukella pontilimi TaxID=2691042 RepID=A0A7C9MQ43_9RHOB|nr:peptidoglycan DD-metalloendopeptidase family protein [Kangsaoukella pontilimi]